MSQDFMNVGLDTLASFHAPVDRSCRQAGRLRERVSIVDKGVTEAASLDVVLRSGVQLGNLRKVLADKGITNIGEVADQLQLLKSLQERDGVFYSYDAFSELGSSTHARVSDGHVVRDCIMWSVNHYLGLNRHPGVIAAAREALDRFGTGCGTSAMSGGMSALHKTLERRLAAHVGKESALVFPTGYTANVGAIAALVGKRDLILSDSENHASIIEGCRASRAHVVTFDHNSVADLEEKLARFRGEFDNAIVIVESAYSMSGDLCPLREIVALKERYEFLLYVDEAHTYGFYGERGSGYCAELGVTQDVDFLMSTLSKATASVGGFVAMDAKYRLLLTWSARPYMFQACFPPADAAAALAALDEIETNPSHAERLHENNARFRRLLTEAGFDLRESKSAIVPVYIEDVDALRHVTSDLFEEGIYTVAVAYPAVGLHEGRLRFVVSAAHTTEQIERTVSALAAVCKKRQVL